MSREKDRDQGREGRASGERRKVAWREGLVRMRVEIRLF